jgi:peptide/nickel transport system permease protein
MRRAALMLLMTMIVAAAGVLLWFHGDYATQDRDQIAVPSSAQHWAGTDDLGRDRAVRVAAALLLGLGGAAAASAIAAALAAAVGVSAAFAPEPLAWGLLYLCDLFLTLPWLFLLMTVRSALPLTLAPLESAAVTFLLLAALGWPAYARVTYAGTKRIRNSDWFLQARASGLRPERVALRYVLPHLRPLLLTQFLLCVPAFLVAEANLGTLGMGISEPLPSWGAMLLELERSSAFSGSGWVFLPIVLLIAVLLFLQLLVHEV